MPFRKKLPSNCFIISKPFINGRAYETPIFDANRTNDLFLSGRIFHPLHYFLLEKSYP